VYDPPPLVDETEAKRKAVGARSAKGKHPFEHQSSFKHTAVARSDSPQKVVTGEKPVMRLETQK